MEWCKAIRHIAACSTSLRGDRKASGDELTALFQYLGHDDVLVAYAAKEELQTFLKIARVHDVIHTILVTSPTTWRSETSGFRFQLLRELIQVKKGGASKNENNLKGNSHDKWSHLHNFPYLTAVIKYVMQLKAIIRCILLTAGGTSAAVPHSVQYETLMFISNFVKCLLYVKISETCQAEFGGLMAMLMEDVFVEMEYCSQPTFVSCAVIGLLGDFQKLVNLWDGQRQADKKMSGEPIYHKWLGQYLSWLSESSCATTALQLLSESTITSIASCEPFIAKSNVFPFLQQWLLLLSRMGVIFTEKISARSGCSGWKRLSECPNFISCAEHQLPSRQKLFAVLAEQDDVMIEFLNNVTRMAYGLESTLKLHFQPNSHLITQIVTNYDQDLLFADLVDNLGQDHRVLLDLLVSNETQMLEYLMRYLHRLSTHWDISKQKLLTADRLEVVMSVLIRLRLDIDRLVKADLFPFGAKPLTRRLVTIEQLYEESDE